MLLLQVADVLLGRDVPYEDYFWCRYLVGRGATDIKCPFKFMIYKVGLSVFIRNMPVRFTVNLLCILCIKLCVSS